MNKDAVVTQQTTLQLLKLCITAIGVFAASAQAADKPNVIFIMTDDLGYGDLGCTGNPVVKTPHIDRLAGEGVQLKNFHVHPFCSPTRAALMTGLHPSRTGVSMTTSRKDILRTDVPTMADYFQASGYRTALFGKWHIGDGCRYSPGYRGFEETLTVRGGGPGTVNDYWGNTKFNDTMLRNGKWVRYEGFTTDVLFTEAMRFIENRCQDVPFFIYLPAFAPHNPRFVPRQWTDTYSEVNGDLAAFAATVTRIDYNVGRLRDFLNTRGLSQNTMVIFTTDNGSSCDESVRVNDGGHRGRKGSPDEHGHRVPCFVHWPKGGLDTKREIPALTTHMDWLPTLIELCQLKKPDIEGLPFDGLSMASLLTDQQNSDDPKWAGRMYTLRNSKGRVIMKGRWRLINGKLCNLDDDPQQRGNVAGKHPELVRELEKHDRDVMASVSETPWKSNRPIYVGETTDECLSFRRPSFYLQGHILAGKRHNATWPVHFLHAGTYELEFRRWAREVNKPLDAAITVEPNEEVVFAGRPVYVNGGGGKGKALPIHAVKLEVGETVSVKEAEPGAAAIVMQITAKEGPATIKATFLDNDGISITTPYYSYIRRVVE